MEVAQEKFIFWSVLERDLKLKLSNHVKNILKYVSVAIALVLDWIGLKFASYYTLIDVKKILFIDFFGITICIYFSQCL